MGQVPPKYMLPSMPYGSSDAVNAVNSVQPAALNPQTPLLPPNFTDPGTATGASQLKTGILPKPPQLGGGIAGGARSPMGGSWNPQRMFGQ